MAQSSRKAFLITALLLCLVLAAVLTTFSYLAPHLPVLFVPYQYFLIGICTGALVVATLGLIAERSEWTHYRFYFFTVMISVFLLVVTNSVIYRLLGGEQFIRRLMKIFWVVFISR